MKVSATLKSNFNQHVVLLNTDGQDKTMQIAVSSTGYGSSINGGELLMVSLATCFCNDLYREAGKRKIQLSGIEVIVDGEFPAEGKPGRDFTYSVKIQSDEPESVIKELIAHTDQVAEIHNTLRKGIAVKLKT